MTAGSSIHDIPAGWAARAPHRLALIDADGRLDWAALQHAITVTSQALVDAGLRPGERLALVGENGIALVVLLFAASRAGLCTVPLNARLTAAEIAALVSHAGARAIACTTANSPAAAAHARVIGAQPLALPAGQAAAAPVGVAFAGLPPVPEQAAMPTPAEPGEAIAALIYTSGTTGRPRGVMLRQRNLLAVAALSAGARGLAPDDVAYGVLPLSHVFGFSSVLLASLRAGAAVWLEPRFDAARCWAALDSGVTVLQGVPTLFARLLAQTPAHPGPGGSRLRALFSGGAPLDAVLKQAVEARFGLPLHNGYGLTENGPSICQTGIDAPCAGGAVGPPLPGVDLRIVDGTGQPVPCGDAGKLWVRGPGVMAGYWRDPEATAQVLVDGWLDTGDVVRQQADGTVLVLGRIKEMIIRSGFKVYPAEVEAAIQRLPGVRQVAVAGRDLPGGEQEVVAFVEWDGDQPGEPARLATALRGLLAPYKLPNRWHSVAHMPLTLSGKVRKAELLADLDAGRPERPPA